LLGNYQETLNDAVAAVTLQPTFINAIEKGKFLKTIFVDMNEPKTSECRLTSRGLNKALSRH